MSAGPRSGIVKTTKSTVEQVVPLRMDRTLHDTHKSLQPQLTGYSHRQHGIIRESIRREGLGHYNSAPPRN